MILYLHCGNFCRPHLTRVHREAGRVNLFASRRFETSNERCRLGGHSALSRTLRDRLRDVMHGEDREGCEGSERVDASGGSGQTRGSRRRYREQEEAPSRGEARSISPSRNDCSWCVHENPHGCRSAAKCRLPQCCCNACSRASN